MDCPVHWDSDHWGWWCRACLKWIENEVGTNAAMAQAHMWEEHGYVVFCGYLDGGVGAYLRARPVPTAR